MHQCYQQNSEFFSVSFINHIICLLFEFVERLKTHKSNGAEHFIFSNNKLMLDDQKPSRVICLEKDYTKKYNFPPHHQSPYSGTDLGGKVLTFLNNFLCSENGTISGEMGAFSVKRKAYRES